MASEAHTGGQSKGEGLRPLKGDRFRFACYPEVACFNECCADLRLILTPYDILRMKRRLEISAGEFLEAYTAATAEEHSLFPMLRLRMLDGGRRPCPFVREEGCSIYEDRPGACRLYPLGRAASFASGRGAGQETYFLVEEAHCRGFQETREWTVGAWLEDQGVGLYNQMNQPWMEIVTSQHPRIRETTEEKLRMFYMTSYNLDRFRDFVFRTRFLDSFSVPSDEVDRIRRDEVSLMMLGMRWLRFVLFGEGLSPVATRESNV
jgi:uncharacterized protein